MIVANYLRNGLALLIPVAIAFTVYLYAFPIFGGCGFPIESGNAAESFYETKKLHWPWTEAGQNATHTKLPPFRLLALGDPQLEGDTSIPILYNGFMPHAKKIYRRVTFKAKHDSLWDRLRMICHDVVDILFQDIPDLLESGRKTIDLFGNDFYMAHIYRTVHWWTAPTHVTVLGDLVGSQWIDDKEFERRGGRFWNRTFRGGERVPDEVAQYPEKVYNVTGVLDGSVEEEIWTRRILNVAGNHDIGYAGDLTPERMARFERVFGKANYELRFELPITDPELNATLHDQDTNSKSRRLHPEIRIIVINDMNLDTPAINAELQDYTYKFINAVIGSAHAVEAQGGFTLILTHIPMFKPEGICTDAPFFDFHTSADGGGLKEQYLLSTDASKGFWEGVLGVSKNPNAANAGQGRPGVILNGHDHAGCDTYHFVNQTNGTSTADRSFEVARWDDAVARGLPGTPKVPGRREITVRSMMGDFGGNAGLYSMWFDYEAWEWKYEYAECPLGTQHFWWFVHSFDFGVLVFIACLGLAAVLETRGVDVDEHVLPVLARLCERGEKAAKQAGGRRPTTSSIEKQGVATEEVNGNVKGKT
ncbi:hypothetical protein N3K66_005301 [Trichothecium roseum]|uniref:Uncharacterized protein n=1 Tax=Trichothecium roseum TaxID=47278 RepID=A0ACC0UY62_9HYPO|nr:hypothetical protein N3K66_005301 [Trichothecium roseum]